MIGRELGVGEEEKKKRVGDWSSSEGSRIRDSACWIAIRQTVVGDWLVGEMRQWDRSTDWMQVESSFVESDGLRMLFA